mmetsp:Transcript_7664/g.9584  ORF Transcript_7664/g.9584 Transcript_7664/m.9584 type:complete len:105 (-) Transcript_7664:17-331(-)
MVVTPSVIGANISTLGDGHHAEDMMVPLVPTYDAYFCWQSSLVGGDLLHQNCRKLSRTVATRCHVVASSVFCLQRRYKFRPTVSPNTFSTRESSEKFLSMLNNT